MQLKSLLMTLKEPIKISQSDKDIPDQPIFLAGEVTSRPSTPLWFACADLLINTQESTWVGLCYRVSEPYKEKVKKLCSNLANKIIQYNDLTSKESQSLYKEFGSETHWVEIKWSNLQADKVEVEQLDSGFWYYTESVDQIQAVAFALEDIDDVMQHYSFKFPSLTSFTHFKPEFIG